MPRGGIPGGGQSGRAPWRGRAGARCRAGRGDWACRTLRLPVPRRGPARARCRTPRATRPASAPRTCRRRWIGRRRRATAPHRTCVALPHWSSTHRPGFPGGRQPVADRRPLPHARPAVQGGRRAMPPPLGRRRGRRLAALCGLAGWLVPIPLLPVQVMRMPRSGRSRHHHRVRVARVDRQSPEVVCGQPLIPLAPADAGIHRLRVPVSGRLVDAAGGLAVGARGVGVAPGMGLAILPGPAPVRTAHDPAQLDGDAQAAGHPRIGFDPSRVVRPGALLPRPSAVLRPVQRARFGPGPQPPGSARRRVRWRQRP